MMKTLRGYVRSIPKVSTIREEETRKLISFVLEEPKRNKSTGEYEKSYYLIKVWDGDSTFAHGLHKGDKVSLFGTEGANTVSQKPMKIFNSARHNIYVAVNPHRSDYFKEGMRKNNVA